MIIKDWIRAAVEAWKGKSNSEIVLKNRLEIVEEEKPIRAWVLQPDGSTIPARDDPRYKGCLTPDGRIIGTIREVPIEQHLKQQIRISEILPPKALPREDIEKMKKFIDSLSKPVI